MSAFVIRTALVPGHERLAPRPRAAITGVVVHRIEVSQEDPSFADTPAEIARFFSDHPIGRKATGGDMPYPLLIAPSGEVTQTVPLGRITPHARAHNPTTIGVGCIGDFRAREPARAQRQALVALAGQLLGALGLAPAALHGHDALTGGSSDPDKMCPGSCLPLPELRADVAIYLAAHPDPVELLW